jgi:membrane protein YqaA with SNARE-associated domain
MAEAVVFFIIPDVLITRAALRSLRSGLLTAAFATAGALLGGMISYAWGAADLNGARHVLDALPAISVEMLDHAQNALANDGMLAAFMGSFSGVPYKVFAVQAASAGIPLSVFVLASIPVRGIRFVLLTMMTRALARYAVPTWSVKRLQRAWAVIWIVNYAIYWTVMPNRSLICVTRMDSLRCNYLPRQLRLTLWPHSELLSWQ